MGISGVFDSDLWGGGDSPIDAEDLYVAPKTLLALMRPLTRMVAAGITPAKAFAYLGETSTNPQVRALCAGIARRVQRGMTEAEAMEDFPRTFSTAMIAEIRQGAVAGQLPDAFKSVADVLEQETKIRAKISGVMFQPLVTVTLLFVTVLIQLGYTMPKLAPTYALVDESVLPGLTVLELQLSRMLVTHPILVMALILGTVGGIVYWVRSPGGQQTVLRLATEMWPLKGLVQQQIRARFLRDLSRLYAFQTGRRMVDLACEAITVDVVRQRLQSVADRMDQGSSLSAALEETDFFPGNALLYVSGGEAAGSLPEMLRAAAAEETIIADEQLDRLIAYLPNVSLILVAVVVGITLWGQYGGLMRLQGALIKKTQTGALPAMMAPPLSAPVLPGRVHVAPGVLATWAKDVA